MQIIKLTITYKIFRKQQSVEDMEIAPTIVLRDIIGCPNPSRAYGVRAIVNEIAWLRAMANVFCPFQDGILRPSWVEYQMERRRRDQIAERLREKQRIEEEESVFHEDLNSLI